MEGKWFSIWMEDKRTLQITRLRNLLSDAENGMSPFSDAFMDQWNNMVNAYERYEEEFSKFSGMTISQIDAWCREDLIKRGAIEECDD